MESERSVQIAANGGDVRTVPLEFDGERESAVLVINGVRYHLERVTPKETVTDHRGDLESRLRAAG